MNYRQIEFDFTSARYGKQTVIVTPKQRRARTGLLVFFALGWISLLVARLYSLQIADMETWQEWALKQHFAQVKLSSERGPIYDRNNRLLAVSVPAGSIYARPKQIKDKKTVANELSRILDQKPKFIEDKISEDRPFVWITRQIPRKQADEIAALTIPGVGSVMESKRIYPFGDSASALVGKAGIDGEGLSGLELAYDKKLRSEEVANSVTRDALGKVIDVSADTNTLPKGETLQLTIDGAVQQIMDEETEEGRQKSRAQHTLAIMADAETGEILGMSQSPAFDYNVAQKGAKNYLNNFAVETVFEPGSMMKPLVAAAAIELGLYNPSDKIDCESGHYQLGPKVIRDVHPSGVISLEDVIIRSSNIGMTKVGLKLGADRLYSALTRYGFGDEPKLGLAGETGGILRPVSRWALVDVATHSFGQGIAVTPLQMVRAVSSIANGGRLPRLKVVEDGSPIEAIRILSERTASQVRAMMYGVVEDEHGTGQKAEIEGVRIGGKTGTAQKARKDGRGYDPGKYVAGFVGFADASEIGIKKTLALMVVVDEPNTDTIYGGTLAAPIFKRIMQRSLHYLATNTHLAPNSGAVPVKAYDLINVSKGRV